jgi:hypothetical protein
LSPEASMRVLEILLVDSLKENMAKKEALILY